MEDTKFSLRPDSDLSKHTTDVPPSFIPLEKPAPIVNTKPELYKTNSVIWQQKSEALLNDYKIGWNIGCYNDNSEVTAKQFFSQLGSALIKASSSEFNKEGMPSQSLAEIFLIVQTSLNMLGNALTTSQLKQHDSKSLVAFLHGFIDSYINQKIKEK